MENIVTLFDAAVAAIIESHETLKAKLTPIFIGYSSNILPPRPERASRILDCEANGAHKLIEDLATGAKAQTRGELGVSPDRLLDSCNRFLEFLQNNLKSSECETAINCIYSKIERFLNLIKGLSGCDPWITTEEYHKRICKLKDSFLNLGNAIMKYEFTLCERAKASPEKRATSTRSKRGVGGKGPKTEFMKRQFKAFERFLTASNYDGEMKKLNSLAAQCWFKNKVKWDAAAKSTGQNKGYASTIVLANAYRRINYTT